MEGNTRREEICPQLLDLIPKNREWLTNRDISTTNNEYKSSHGCRSDEKKLELRLGLGPPGENWRLKNDNNNRERVGDDLSLGYGNQTQTPWRSSSSSSGKATSFLHQLPVVAKEVSQNLQVQNARKKSFSPATNTAVPNTSSSQKRTAPAPVVGWPPIRSFRKNLASTSTGSKPIITTTESQNDKIPRDKPVETSGKSTLFVKINMEGVAIGRKVDLKAYDTYEKLSSAVDQLFRGLLAAQRDSCGGGIQIKQEEEKAITGLLDGSGEYTLVYEDNEGDRMLVGDVPWHMFVSTVKRLRVLKSSELSALSLSGKQDRMPLEPSLK